MLPSALIPLEAALLADVEAACARIAVVPTFALGPEGIETFDETGTRLATIKHVPAGDRDGPALRLDVADPFLRRALQVRRGVAPVVWQGVSVGR